MICGDLRDNIYRSDDNDQDVDELQDDYNNSSQDHNVDMNCRRSCRPSWWIEEGRPAALCQWGEPFHDHAVQKGCLVMIMLFKRNTFS